MGKVYWKIQNQSHKLIWNRPKIVLNAIIFICKVSNSDNPKVGLTNPNTNWTSKQSSKALSTVQIHGQIRFIIIIIFKSRCEQFNCFNMMVDRHLLVVHRFISECELYWRWISHGYLSPYAKYCLFWNADRLYCGSCD